MTCEEKLLGLPVVITRPHEQSAGLAERIRRCGGVPITAPVMEIRYQVDDLEKRLFEKTYDAVLVTSANAARALISVVESIEGASRDGGMPVTDVFAVGAATARVAESAGWNVTKFPGVKTSKGFAKHLIDRFKGTRRQFLLPRGALADDAFARALVAAGHEVTSVVCYETLEKCIADSVWQELVQGNATAVVLFFSPSAATFFSRQWERWKPLVPEMNWLFACIGDTTRSACESLGLPVLCTAEHPTEESILKAVSHAISKG